MMCQKIKVLKYKPPMQTSLIILMLEASELAKYPFPRHEKNSLRVEQNDLSLILFNEKMLVWLERGHLEKCGKNSNFLKAGTFLRKH